MKIFTPVLILLLFVLPKTNMGQCNYAGNTPISIGQIIIDTSFCPSSGKITLNNITGGGGYYVYEIISGPVIRIIQSQNFFNALPGGQYRVRVTGCNGALKDTIVNVVNTYSQLYISYWQQAITRLSGLQCGITNNGVYKIVKPVYPGGTAPYRIQISTSASFTNVAYQPGFDSAVFNGLNENTTYFVRITDACNNFQTTNFTTPVATPVVPLSVPSLSFQWGYFYGSCSNNQTIFIYFSDSATGTPYNLNNLYSNKVYWGNKDLPYLRLKIEDAVNATVYADRHVAISKSGSLYYANTNTQYNGETGLAAPGSGFYFYNYNPNNTTNVMPTIYAGSEFPANAPLKITIFFPGGDHCGTPVPAYSKTFYYNLSTYPLPQAKITAINNNCNTGGSYFKVDFNINYFKGQLTLVDPSPVYTVLKTQILYPTNLTYTTINYSPLIVGHNYRVILEDSCGRKDSADIVYNPGYTPVPPPVIKDSVKAALKCPANPLDTVYSILIKPMPAGYSITSASISGYGSVGYFTIPNWNGTTGTGYRLNKLLPPGNYTYKIVWLYQCQTDTISQNITISPIGAPPSYNRDLLLSVVTNPQTCSSNGYTAININGYLRNINTNYTINNVRLVGVPNNYVFPLNQIVNILLNNNGDNIYFFNTIAGDTVKIYPNYSGMIINQGQEGTYTIAMDIRCPDGTLIETVTKEITVTAPAPYIPYSPVLKYANALICDGNTNELKINMLPVGGSRPFYYEYKSDTAVNYIPTGNAGTDSVVIISPAPAAGSIYDIRVVDACGNSATSKVSVSSFTGNFYLYQYPNDCKNHPFDIRVGTSSINGAYYTWKRNGVTFAEGYNMASILITNVSVDTVSVTINMFDCYSRTVTRVYTFTNPCHVVILPVNSLQFSGQRYNSSLVQLNWKTEYEPSLKYFDVEKSKDGKNFNYIGSLGNIYLNGINEYVFADPDSSPLLYYRLKMIDNDGKITYSNIITIKNSGLTVKATIQVNPNPASNYITFFVNSEKLKSFKIDVFNENGQLVLSTAVDGTELTSGKKVNITSWSGGTYFVALNGSNGVAAVTKFIKK